jgi:C4-dicarboxylate transporter DctM subunit
MIAALFACLLFFLLIGVPVAFAIGLSGVAALLVQGQIPFEVVPQRIFAAVDSWTLMAVPLFILAGELMNACGIAERAVRLVGRLRGGLPIVSVTASMFFASITGSSSASTAAVGSMMIPAMKRRGYPMGFATAFQAAGGALGPIIPPSIIMIVVGYVTETSIAALFVGGIVPGILIAGALVSAAYRKARIYEPEPEAGMDEEGLEGSWGRTLLEGLPAVGLPVVVVGGILAGVFTATEAAGIAVAYGLVVGFALYRELRVSELRPILVRAALRSCVVMFVATCAYLFAWMIAVGRVPDQMGGMLQSWAESPLSFLLLANLALIVVGMFMESIAAIIVLMPILFPLALQFGVDPIHFGVLASVNLCIGMVTPPYGATLFVACSISGVSVSEVAPWTLRPVMAMVAVLALITLVPGTVILLPRLLGLL